MPLAVGATMSTARSTVLPGGTTPGMGSGVLLLIEAPSAKTTLYSSFQSQFPSLRRRQIFWKATPGASRVLSGMVTSVMNFALSTQAGIGVELGVSVQVGVISVRASGVEVDEGRMTGPPGISASSSGPVRVTLETAAGLHAPARFWARAVRTYSP